MCYLTWREGNTELWASIGAFRWFSVCVMNLRTYCRMPGGSSLVAKVANRSRRLCFSRYSRQGPVFPSLLDSVSSFNRICNRKTAISKLCWGIQKGGLKSFRVSTAVGRAFTVFIFLLLLVLQATLSKFSGLGTGVGRVWHFVTIYVLC